MILLTMRYKIRVPALVFPSLGLIHQEVLHLPYQELPSSESGKIRICMMFSYCLQIAKEGFQKRWDYWVIILTNILPLDSL
jgi:hypothetical protein